MITVEEAQQRILESMVHYQPRPVTVSLAEAVGRVLAQAVVSDLDIPPFDNSSMDGFALLSSAVIDAKADHPVDLEVAATISAGHPLSDLSIAPHQCYRIMTGAPVPKGVDSVIQVEWTEPHGDWVRITRPVPPGLNIRYKGSDIADQTEVLTLGTVLTPALIGIMATLGRTHCAVFRRPSIAIVSTGDELVDPSLTPGPGQIRNSNAYALYAAVLQAGGDPVLIPHAPDDLHLIIERLNDAARYDLILSSGGVSVGDFDLVKTALQQHGTQNFWRVNMKPGKPVVFGHYRDTPFFGLPGNPVSALVTFELFVRPMIRQMQGDFRWPRLVLQLPLLEDFTEVADRRHYVRCQIRRDSLGALGVIPSPDQGSAIQTSWLQADGLMVIPEHTGPWLRGATVSVMLLHS